MFKTSIPEDLALESKKAQAEAEAAHERANAAAAAVTAARARVDDVEHAFGAGKATMDQVRAARAGVEEAELRARLAAEAATVADVANGAKSARVRELTAEQAKTYVSRDAYSARLQANDERMVSLLRELHAACIEREQIVDDRRNVATTYGSGAFLGPDTEHLDWLAHSLANVCASEGIHPETYTRLSPNRHGTFGHQAEIGAPDIGRPKKKAGASA